MSTHNLEIRTGDNPGEQSNASDGNDNPSFEPVPTDSEFYFADLYLLVENKIFKVLRRTFEDNSEVFANMFLMPKSSNDTVAVIEGADPKHPIPLPGVLEHEMVLLLRILYLKNLYYIQDFSVEEMQAILRLSTMWGFDATRGIIIARLSKATDPTTKILMYDDAKYALDPYSWFLPAAKVFVSRKEKLTVEEGLKLGMSHTLRICAAREEWARIRYGDVGEILAQVYELPPRKAEDGSETK